MKRMIIVLTAVTVFSGMILASSYRLFLPEIEANQERALNASLAGLFAGTEKPGFEPVGDGTPPIYRVIGGDGELLGYAVQIEATGYGGPMRMLVGLSPDLGTITSLEIVENLETPGLGARIDEPEFKAQFAGLDPWEAVSFLKNIAPDPEQNRIEALSGATISTSAVVGAVNGHLAPVLEELRGGAAGEAKEGKE